MTALEPPARRDGPGWVARLAASRRVQSICAAVPGLRAIARRDGEALFDLVAGFVHSQVLYYSGYILRLAARCGTPIRVAQFQNSHDSRRGWHRPVVRSVMRRWIDRYATHITAVSEGAMAGIWGLDWRREPRCRFVQARRDALSLPCGFVPGG